jgi:hypothetical protein
MSLFNWFPRKPAAQTTASAHSAVEAKLADARVRWPPLGQTAVNRKSSGWHIAVSLQRCA